MNDDLIWAPRAWIEGRWADAVLLRVGADGCWAEVSPGTAPPPTRFNWRAPCCRGW